MCLWFCKVKASITLHTGRKTWKIKQSLTISSNEDTSVSGEVACSAFLAFSCKAVRTHYKIAQDTDLSENSKKNQQVFLQPNQFSDTPSLHYHNIVPALLWRKKSAGNSYVSINFLVTNDITALINQRTLKHV